MQRQILIIAIVGVLIIAGVTAAGFYLARVAERNKTAETSPTPEVPETPEPTPTATPSPTPSLLPTAPPRDGSFQSKGGTQTYNQPLSTTTKPVTERVQGDSTQKQLSIRFVDTPSQVESGSSFTISWFIDGPEGMMGENTTLSTSYNASSSSSGASASSSSNTSQSFGGFRVPQVFRSKVQFGGNQGNPLNVKVSAEVNGQTLTATKTIQIQ